MILIHKAADKFKNTVIVKLHSGTYAAVTYINTEMISHQFVCYYHTQAVVISV
jgi:hypothetical protein